MTYGEYQVNISRDIHKPNSANNNKRVKIASIVGSAAGIALTVAGLGLAKKGNPLLALKNISYSEKDIVLISTGAIAGGLVGGLASDKNKENFKPKLREASQQLFANTVIPVGFLAVAEKVLEKSKIKLPQINSTNKVAKAVNVVLSALPKIVTTVASLGVGMIVGNKVMDKVNNKIFKENNSSNIHPEDMIVHADDVCLSANMLLKDSQKLSAITTKILPWTFIIPGTKTGMKQA